MRPVFAFLLLALLCFASTKSESDSDFEEDNNDFAEFDDEFVGGSYYTEPAAKNAEASAGGLGSTDGDGKEERPEQPRKVAQSVDSDEEDGLVEDDDEFEHFQVGLLV